MIKRYRSWERGEHRREWAVLNVLALHAPGLAPAPVRADLDGSPPRVVMSRLPGTPLRGLPTGPATRRNPPGTLDRQAERVLALLDS
ncbi:hypothetical protein AB0L65_43590 [Nonomuraea sp. NPDC052116]|uniref:hypothetical protein n=1 Tax=Nonomuraea sp. NPDC052116 TaxID=3155665 RepID=UPI0034466E32